MFNPTNAKQSWSLIQLGVHSLTFTWSLSVAAELSCSLACSLLCIGDLDSVVCKCGCQKCIFRVRADNFCSGYPLQFFLTATQASVSHVCGIGFEGSHFFYHSPIWFCLLTRHLFLPSVCGRFQLVCRVTKNLCHNCL